MVVPAAAEEVDGGGLRGRSAGVDGDDSAFSLQVDQAEQVSSYPCHVRAHDSQDSRCRDGGIHHVPTIHQNPEPRLGCEAVARGNHSAGAHNHGAAGWFSGALDPRRFHDPTPP